MRKNSYRGGPGVDATMISVLLIILAVGVFGFDGCSRPALTDGERETVKVKNTFDSDMNELTVQAERLDVEWQQLEFNLDADEARAAHAVNLAQLNLDIQTLEAKHQTRMRKNTLNAWIGLALDVVWFLVKTVILAAFAAVFVLLAWMLGVLIKPARQWLLRRAQETVANEQGQFPARWVVGPSGQLTPFNMNRALQPGAIIDIATGQITGQDTTDPMLQLAVTRQDQEARHWAAMQRLMAVNPSLDLADLFRLMPAETPLLPAGPEDAAPLEWPAKVYLADLLREQGGARLDNILLGLTPREGEWEVLHSAMDVMIHVACGGASGWGKSNMVHAIVAQLVMAGNVQLAMADATGSSLGRWAECKYLEWPIATEPGEIAALFLEIGKEKSRRAELYAACGNPDDLVEYNQQRGTNPPLQPFYLVTDEANSLLKQNAQASEVFEDLAHKGRKFGIGLIFAATRWTADVIPQGGKVQFSTRLGFKCNSRAMSNNLLMTGAAADLNNRGRAIAIIPGEPTAEFQAPYVTKPEIEAVLFGHDGPRHAAPIPLEIVATKPTKKKPTAVVTRGERSYVRHLLGQGDTNTAIAEEVWKIKSGPRVTAVQEIRVEWQAEQAAAAAPA